MSESNSDPLTESPEEPTAEESASTPAPESPEAADSRFASFWQRVQDMGITGSVTRIGSSILTVLLVVVAVYTLGRFYLNRTGPSEAAENNDAAAPTTDPAPGDSADISEIILPEYTVPDTAFFYGSSGIAREAQPETVIPSRSRTEVTYYEVQTGDSVFSIAEQFGLEPETILWGNYDVLRDNPRVISPGMVLNILPTDGIYYEYNAGESLVNIARSFEVETTEIIEYPGNELDPYETNPEDPGIADGTWLIIPGGQRELQDWGPPAISRSNPAVASYYGEGACGAVYEGPIGDGIFTWPAVQSYLSGYDWNPGIHEAIDIGGVEGSAIYAADTGVVVYSGWSQYGYGYMVVIDHGNGWQTAYAHLLYTSAGCGQTVYRGDTIGALGSTGNSTGPHLHFEMKYLGGNVNPWLYLY
jgi:murein DD-endopeptidase MepM/ murein hydrolase activator NlpD